MKVAVTYNEGEIFQHFGKTEQFKVYEVEDEKVISGEVIGSNGAGHGELAAFLAENHVDVLICGGIGQGAQDALSEVGIEIFAGVSGNADEAIEVFLNGELISAGVTCDHHDHEESHDCGGHCGGGCSGCGSHQPIIEGKNAGKNAGKTCKVHYKGTLNDGSQFDSSYDRGEPLEFVCGMGMMIQGFDIAVANMEVGQVVDIHLMPEQAYGMPDPNAIFTVEIAQMPGAEEVAAGEMVYLADAMGNPFPVKVVAKDDTTITFDANHEMAGKELNFRIELVEVQ